jgi:hypothetical protein
LLNCGDLWQSWQFGQSSLSLSLFVLRVLTDHAHHALAVYDFALVANLLD